MEEDGETETARSESRARARNDQEKDSDDERPHPARAADSPWTCFKGVDAVVAGGNAVMADCARRSASMRIRGLTSARGADLNDRVGVVVGFDPYPEPRYHLRVQGLSSRVFKIKPGNALEDGVYVSPPVAAAVSDARVDAPTLRRLADARFDGKPLRRHLLEHATAERPDLRHRASRLVQAVEGSCDPPQTFVCGDAGLEGADDPFVRNMMAMKPPCVGDGHLRLASLWDHGADDAHAARRLAEYPISGFCVPCQVAYIEMQGCGGVRLG